VEIKMTQKFLKTILFSIVIISSSVMCSLFAPSDSNKVSDQDKQATIDSLQLTMSMMQNQVMTATVVPTKPLSFPTMEKLSSGSISGTLSYPSEGIPPLRIVAIKVGTKEYIATEAINQNIYKLENIPAGKYHVLAYRINSEGADPGLIGGYSQFVLCGQTADCTDHTLIDVEVAGESEIVNINPMDWYAPAGSFPPDPTK
jgi:predicted phage tail protein